MLGQIFMYTNHSYKKIAYSNKKNIFQYLILIQKKYSRKSETEICRERGSIAPRKVFVCPESFCTEQTFV